MPPPLLPEYVPQGVDLFEERSNLNGLILAGVAYGILFTIFVQCIQLILRVYTPSGTSGGSNRLNLRRPSWLLYYTVAMFILATVGFGANTKFIQMTYIDYRDVPGGPNAFTQGYYAHPINLAAFVSYVLMSWLADGLLLYRFSLLYSFNRLVIALPAMVYLGVIAMSTSLIIAIKSEGDFWHAKTVSFGIAYWSLSIGLNIGLTLLIAGKLIHMRSKVREVLGRQHSTPYVSVMAMIVESASLYSVWGLVFIILYARHSKVQNIVLPPLGQIQGIAPLLIIFRVGQGKAWTSETVTATRTNNIMIAPGRGQSSGGVTGSTGIGAIFNHTASYPLSDMSGKVSIQVGKSTIVTHDDAAEWENELKRTRTESINTHTTSHNGQ